MTRSALLAVVVAALAGPVQAQAVPEPQELLALTFYHQQQDEASVRAELQRLQILYPDWQPPADLSRLGQTAPGSEIDTIYRQIGARQFDAARATIAEARSAFPGWEPPADMLDLLATSEGQVLLDAALSEGDLSRALALVGERPGLLRCDRINNAWRIAELQEAGGMSDVALGTYRAVLGACVDSADIIATLEKASALATPEDLRSLFSQVTARLPEMAEPLAPVRTRLLGDAPPAASTAGPASPSASPSEPSATASGPTAPAPRPVSPAAPAAPAPQGASGTAIYQQAWQTYNMDRPMEAIAQFEAALRGRLDATQRRDAQYGIALAYLKLGMTDSAARLAAIHDLTRDQRVDLERQILDQRGVAAYQRRDYRRAIEFFDAIEALTGTLRRDLDVLRAYAYFNSQQHERARREFTRLHNELATAETRRALSALE
ncbi:hypothetical protein ACFQXB_10370 [Plastorhodobacter daqingensis]|uniref:Tetratricopeptide repeat protein n=1 Tax=Plastorhodobacter daqingensis TaxID=1387281 RepID=A0ABW2UKS7_9RHOB